MKERAVIWDFGGVITSSPFDNFKKFEISRNLPAGFIRMVNSQNSDFNAWALLEKGEIDNAMFDQMFLEESRNLGQPIRGDDVLPLINCDIRDEVVSVIQKLKAIGIFQLCLTNNINKPPSLAKSLSDDYQAKLKDVMGYFDYVLESSKLGIRKPDVKIYQLAIEKIGLNPSDIVYFDDLGINLKPARNLGVQTVKVLSKNQLIDNLRNIFPEVFESERFI